jgi:two-component system phosphate regulon response regulator PhoB
VDVQILGLRKKLGEHGRHIETVRGVGYRLAGEK